MKEPWEKPDKWSGIVCTFGFYSYFCRNDNEKNHYATY